MSDNKNDKRKKLTLSVNTSKLQSAAIKKIKQNFSQNDKQAGVATTPSRPYSEKNPEKENSIQGKNLTNEEWKRRISALESASEAGIHNLPDKTEQDNLQSKIPQQLKAENNIKNIEKQNKTIENTKEEIVPKKNAAGISQQKTQSHQKQNHNQGKTNYTPTFKPGKSGIVYNTKKPLISSTSSIPSGSRPSSATPVPKKSNFSPPTVVRDVIIFEDMTPKELAAGLAIRVPVLIKKALQMGIKNINVNQSIDIETSELFVIEFGHNPIYAKKDLDLVAHDLKQSILQQTKTQRPPIVTIMGHVNHGKTSLLDNLRKSNIAAQEAGGITQHIGAYQINYNGKEITFIDTPGHEAFSKIRARGASITDIAIIVIAADESIKTQTIESIKHAKQAKVPIIIAINKIDAEGSNPEKVKTDLLSHEIIVESMGGETLCVEISVLKNLHLDKLLEAILLQAEMMELKSVNSGLAMGTVLESKIAQGQGAIATIIVNHGELKKGDIFVIRSSWGKIRTIRNCKNQICKTATPAMPVEITGLSETAKAGEELLVMEDEAQARKTAKFYKDQERPSITKLTMPQMLQEDDGSKKKKLSVIIKSDTQGSLEAISKSILKFQSEEIEIEVVLSGIGAINETDVNLAISANAILIGFNVRADTNAKKISQQEKIEFHYYSIIYDIVKDIKSIINGILDPIKTEKIIGTAKVLQTFNIKKLGMIAGCIVEDGKIERSAQARIFRDNKILQNSIKIESLKREKNNVNEIIVGQECGILLSNFNDVQKDDKIEFFLIEETAKTI